MKNLKIGTKIFVAFGTVIFFLAVSTAVVFFANTGILGNVEKIDYDSQLQTTGNTLKDNFLLARIAAIQLLSTTDAAAYDNFVKRADAATQSYAEVYDIISKQSFLDKFRPAFQQAESDYKAYIAKAADLGKANELEEARIADMNSVGATLAEYGNLIFLDQMDLLNDEITAGDMTPSAQQRRSARIQSGADIALNISQFRLYAREMMASFDTGNMAAALEIIDETYAALEAYNQESTIPLNIEHSQLLLDNIAAYRIALVDFGAACDSAAQAAAELSPLGATALESLSSAVEALDAAMSTQVSSTTQAASSTLIAVMAVSLLSIVVAVSFAVVIMRGITRPVAKMVAAADALSLGDVNVDVHYESADEIGALSASFEKMLAGIQTQVTVIERLADGDLTVSVNPRSPKDTMGYGLQKMVSNLNNMFGEINTSTAQVAAGSKQIADGSQSLAQGSTQQASAVEQLSSSIADIAQKTRANAELADKTAKLANTIKTSAEKGSRQMDEMMSAVKEINQASQSINKVIKVIDDIAFQTNILALNAAVEAARAGQHGKGFAVVAEEVRSLAAKSAEAAKDTGGLIANSMEKAELGARIADETAASLGEIVSGINESSQLVSEIARSSEEQTEGIEQINKGIDQVAQVVQQNSATAEESAAASEEMSGQASALEELIAQFKLKDSGSGRFASPGHTGALPGHTGALPGHAAGGASPKQLVMPEKKPLGGTADFGKY